MGLKRWFTWRRHPEPVNRYGGLAGGALGSVGVGGMVGPSNPNVGQPQQGAKGTSDQRFRSFAERYMIARAHFFRTDAAGLKEDMWQCVLDAKTAYHMIERTGRNIEPEAGAGF